MEHAFRYNYGSVRNAKKLSLDDGREGQLDDLVNCDGRFVEHLRNDGHRAVCGLAYSKSKVSCTAAHG